MRKDTNAGRRRYAARLFLCVARPFLVQFVFSFATRPFFEPLVFSLRHASFPCAVCLFLALLVLSLCRSSFLYQVALRRTGGTHASMDSGDASMHSRRQGDRGVLLGGDGRQERKTRRQAYRRVKQKRQKKTKGAGKGDSFFGECDIDRRGASCYNFKQNTWSVRECQIGKVEIRFRVGDRYGRSAFRHIAR